MNALLAFSGTAALTSLACSPVLAEAIIKGPHPEVAWAFLGGVLALACVTVFLYGWKELS